MIAAAIDVYKIYKEKDLETVAVRGISLNLHEGEIVAVVGPSGSGKSTLLGMIGGTIQPTSGKVYWRNLRNEISNLNPDTIIKRRRSFIGFVFQEETLLSNLTVLQNVELAAQIVGLRFPKDHIIGILERVGLGDRAMFIPSMLSNGERKRVEIAAALMNNPKIVLADEPTGNLDFQTGKGVLDLFKELNQELNTTFLIVTHSQQVASIAKNVFEMRDGVFVGSHSEDVDLRNLDKSRLANLDIFNRLTIPSHLLEKIGNPRTFLPKVNDGQIVLVPRQSNFPNSQSQKAVACRLCGKIIRERRKDCPNCGVMLVESENPQN